MADLTTLPPPSYESVMSIPASSTQTNKFVGTTFPSAPPLPVPRPTSRRTNNVISSQQSYNYNDVKTCACITMAVFGLGLIFFVMIKLAPIDANFKGENIPPPYTHDVNYKVYYNKY